MNVDMIGNLVNQFKDNIYFYKNSNYNESACRLEFIDLFLKILNWDVSNESKCSPRYREVIVEDYSKETGRPDYSMTLGGVTKFFVEAKKPYVDICKHSKSIFQARSYGWSAKHPITVLTNFEWTLIYDTSIMPSSDDHPEVALIGKYHYLDYEEKFNEISNYISRDIVYSGSFDEQYKDIKGIGKQVDDVFLDQINKWRLRLGQYLYENGFDIEIINDTTQDFINQIVFLRICEDRNLPTYRTLVETIENHEMIKESLNELYIQADKRYNSGLFNRDYLIFDLNNDIISDIIKELYYPQSPYVFNLIESSLLGQIYEMFLVKHLILDNEKIILQEKKENENRSVVTTPIEIVKYMIEKSLAPIVNGKEPDQIKNIKIADIATGSGVYLVEVFEYLTNYCVEWYKENNIDALLHLGGDSYKLSLREKKEILLSCIFGVDIDPHAVEVAKFSLLLKLLEDENRPSVENEKPILPELSDNILMGNSLIDWELVEKYKVGHEIQDLNPFDWSKINNNEQFDLIIGNPPYVKTEDMISILPESEVMIYKKHYNSSYKQFDKYFIFIEKALEVVKDNGAVCFIIPNKFSKITSGKKLRELITKESYVKEFIDFGASQLFKGKAVYSSIIFLEKKKNQQFTYREVENLNNWWLTKDEATLQLKLDSTILTQNPWVLVADREEMCRISKLYEDSVPLKKIARAFNGIQTSAERPPVYWFSIDEIISENDNYYYIKKFEKNYKIEKSILKLYFKPVKQNEKGMYSYDILRSNKWIIFPYDDNGELFNIEVMQNEFPGTYTYLKDRYNLLIPKQLSENGKGRDMKFATNNTWYHYGRLQSISSFQGCTKLIVGILSKRPMYAYDTNDLVIASGGTAGFCAIEELENSQYKLEFLQAYLTHPFIEKIMSIIGSDFEGEFYSRGTSVLDVVPIKNINFNNLEERKIHDTIVEKSREIYKINIKLDSQLSRKDELIITQRKERLIREIMTHLDRLFY